MTIGGFSRLVRTGDGTATGPETPIVRENWRYKCPKCNSIQVRRIRKHRNKWKCNHCEAKFKKPVDGRKAL